MLPSADFERTDSDAELNRELALGQCELLQSISAIWLGGYE